MDEYRLRVAYARLRRDFYVLRHNYRQTLAALERLRGDVRQTRLEFERLKMIDEGRRAERDWAAPLQ
jgi:hypothetical protein